VVASAQPRNKLKNRRSEDNKIPTFVWKKYGGERRYRAEKENQEENKKCREGRQK